MKKILLITLVLALSTSFIGCLKDKGFDTQEYGINSPENSPAGIGFPLAFSANVYGLDLVGTPQIVSDILVANLLAGNTAPSDIKVNLVENPTLIANYNTDNLTSVVSLPASLFSLSANPIIISKGKNLGKITLNISSALTLNPSITYGLGFSISSVDAGYTIASNMKNILLLFNIKNKYDGVYNLKGVHNRSPFTFPFNIDVEMITTGPSSVAMFLPPPFNDFGQPIGTAPGAISWYGNAVSPNFTFDPATNLATGVNLQVGSAVTLALVTTGGIVNRYEPGPKKMFLTYQYNNNDLRRFYDTLTFLRKR